MEIDIINQKDNKILNRNEVKFVCGYKGEPTPKLLDVKSKLISLLNTKKDLIVVDSLQPHFGEAKALGYAKVYVSKKDLEYIETESVMAKNAQEEAPVEESEEVVDSKDEVAVEESEEVVDSEDEVAVEESEEESEDEVAVEESEEESEDEVAVEESEEVTDDNTDSEEESSEE